MTELRDFDESSLLWAAAFVDEVDPLVVLDGVEIADLAALVAEVDAIDEPIGAAARLLARHQPLNVTIESVRALANGTSATSQTVQSIAWSLALVVVCGSLATRRFRSVTV